MKKGTKVRYRVGYGDTVCQDGVITNGVVRRVRSANGDSRAYLSADQVHEANQICHHCPEVMKAVTDSPEEAGACEAVAQFLKQVQGWAKHVENVEASIKNARDTCDFYTSGKAEEEMRAALTRKAERANQDLRMCLQDLARLRGTDAGA